MSRHMRVLPAVLIAGIALLVGARAPVLRAQDQIPFSETHLFFEFNSSAQDLGIQVFLDGEGWKTLEIVGPGGRRLLDLEAKGSVRILGLTELFFESVEPPLAEFPSDSLFKLFPEGEYHFRGMTVEGDEQVGTATLTHDIPDGPIVLSPEEGGLTDRDNTVIRWALVTTPAGIQIRNYQVIVEDRQGKRVFTVDLLPKVDSVLVPKSFLRPGTRYLFEVLAKEVSGNQTITEGSFQTR